MSICRKDTENPQVVQGVLGMYRSSELPVVEEICRILNITRHTADWILKKHLAPAEFAALKAIRYSRSKTGTKNPMRGKQAPNFIGEVDDGYGYLTCLKDGKRQFVHRVVMAEVLGLKELPESLDVHHIDEDPKNNALDNLALVTKSGHRQIHFLQAKDRVSVALKKSSLWEVMKSMTSQ